MNRVVIGLGGNLEGTPGAFSKARAWLGELLLEPVFSSLYRTAPQLDTEQAPFWNAAAGGWWEGGSWTLLERLLMWESAQGRVRDASRPKGPRVLDLDLLLFGTETIRTPRLGVPHPALPERRFALEPLVELFPDLKDARTGLPWADSLARLGPQGVDRSSRTW